MTNIYLTLAITALLALWRSSALREGVLKFIPKLPQWAQPLPPLLLGALAVLGQGYLDGLRGEALADMLAKDGGQVGIAAIGAWHIWKRVKQPLQKNAAKVGCILVLFIPSCFSQARSFTADAWPVLCQSRLYAVPALRERAARKGVPLEEIVVKACTSKEVIDPLAVAVEQALIDAKKKGLLDAL